MPKVSQGVGELGFNGDSLALVSLFSVTPLHCLSSMLNEDMITEFIHKECSRNLVINFFYPTTFNKCLLCV